MPRINRPTMWMDMAAVAARRATCFRSNVGALIVKDNDSVSVGYNGPPSGEPHCAGDECPLIDGSCQRSVHAERNAITRAIRKLRVSHLEGYDLYCTFSPCLICAKFIHANRLSNVYYRHSYRLKDGLDYLTANHRYCQVYKVTESGIIISQRSGKIVEMA